MCPTPVAYPDLKGSNAKSHDKNFFNIEPAQVVYFVSYHCPLDVITILILGLLLHILALHDSYPGHQAFPRSCCVLDRPGTFDAYGNIQSN